MSSPPSSPVGTLFGHVAVSMSCTTESSSDAFIRTSQYAVQTQLSSPRHVKLVVDWNASRAKLSRHVALQLAHALSLYSQNVSFVDQMNELSCGARRLLFAVALSVHCTTNAVAASTHFPNGLIAHCHEEALVCECPSDHAATA